MPDGIDFFRGPSEGILEPAWTAAVAAGTVQSFTLPNSSHSGHHWGSISIRRLGRNLNEAVAKANAFRIQAHQSDVALYLFEGDFFDGKFQAIRVNRGGIRWSRFGGMGSFILQRDAFIDVAGGQPAEIITGVLQNSLIPTAMLADRITAVIHDGVSTQRGRFYHNRVTLKRGRLFWDTLEGVARLIDSRAWTLDKKRWPYRDYLRYSYKSTGRLKADGANYDIYIDMWFEPVLDQGRLVFAGRFWRVRVSRHIWHRQIQDAVASQVKNAFENAGDTMTRELELALRQLLGRQIADTILSSNRQLVFSHPCIYDVQRVGVPEHTYTTAQINNICGWTTPSYAASPGIRLL